MKILWFSLVLVPIYCQFWPYETAKKYEDMKRRPMVDGTDKEKQEVWGEPTIKQKKYLNRLMDDLPIMESKSEFRLLSAASKFTQKIPIYYYKLESPEGEILYVILKIRDIENGRYQGLTMDDVKFPREDPLVEQTDIEKRVEVMNLYYNQWDDPSAMHLQFLDRLMGDEPSMAWIKMFKVLSAVSVLTKKRSLYYYKLESPSGDILYLTLTLWDTERDRRKIFTKDDVNLSRDDPLVEQTDIEKQVEWDDPSAMHLQFLDKLMDDEPRMSRLRKYKVLSAASKFTKKISIYYYKLKSPKGKIRYLRLILWDTKEGRRKRFTKDDAKLSRYDPLVKRTQKDPLW